MSGRKFCKSSFALARRRARRNKKESLCRYIISITKAFLFFSEFFPQILLLLNTAHLFGVVCIILHARTRRKKRERERREIDVATE